MSWYHFLEPAICTESYWTPVTFELGKVLILRNWIGERIAKYWLLLIHRCWLSAKTMLPNHAIVSDDDRGIDQIQARWHSSSLSTRYSMLIRHRLTDHMVCLCMCFVQVWGCKPAGIRQSRRDTDCGLAEFLRIRCCHKDRLRCYTGGLVAFSADWYGFEAVIFRLMVKRVLSRVKIHTSSTLIIPWS